MNSWAVLLVASIACVINGLYEPCAVYFVAWLFLFLFCELHTAGGLQMQRDKEVLELPRIHCPIEISGFSIGMHSMFYLVPIGLAIFFPIYTHGAVIGTIFMEFILAMFNRGIIRNPYYYFRYKHIAVGYRPYLHNQDSRVIIFASRSQKDHAKKYHSIGSRMYILK